MTNFHAELSICNLYRKKVLNYKTKLLFSIINTVGLQVYTFLI